MSRNGPHNPDFAGTSRKFVPALLLSLLIGGYALAQVEENLPDYSWVNQVTGPRPEYVWENREDVIYHDLSYPAEIETAPEMVPFMHRAWVFNTAMQWHRRPEGILCYAAPATLALTGEEQVSAWHSDPANEIVSRGARTRFVKRSTNRRRDCAVLPAFQFHLGQNPILELDVDEASDDWQFVVAVKGRSGAPLLSSGWRNGPAKVTFNLAEALRRKGFDLNYAELHFVVGTWTQKPEDQATVSFKLMLPGHATVVASLPVVRRRQQVGNSGVPIVATVVDEQGDRLTATRHVRVAALLDGKRIDLEENEGFWKANIPVTEPSDYLVKLVAEGAVHAETQLPVRVTDGAFWKYDASHHQFERGGKMPGPLSGSYMGNVFVRDAGLADESLVQGQQAWDRWDRSNPPGEHLHYWEGLTTAELESRCAYLQICGWDLLHVCQHWGIWERLDVGGRISPHGAEQMALYLRTAAKHGLAVIQALTHYEYAASFNGRHGTVPFKRYVDADLHNDDFFQPGRNPKFETLFHQYLSDYITVFQDETALFAMTASGEGDATVGHARAHDVFDFVTPRDKNHLFLAEPTHILNDVPRSYTTGWRQPLFGARTYFIANDFYPEYDLGVEFKLYQMGRLAMAEGSWGTSNLYTSFHRQVLGEGGPDESWIGSQRYRLRLRDSMYLGLVHRLPKMMTWDEQISEDEHRMVREIRGHVDWRQPFQEPRIAVRLENDQIGKDHRGRLVAYETAFARLGLGYRLIHHDDPIPDGVDINLEASEPFDKDTLDKTLPASLLNDRPLTVTEGYAFNATWSEDRGTLLAYVYNVADHFESRFMLAGRFHRRPQPRDLTLRLANLPAEPLTLRVYDLNEKRLLLERIIAGGDTLVMKQTNHDYFVLVTPK